MTGRPRPGETEVFIKKIILKYSQTCVQWPPLGPEKRGRYAEGYMKKDQW